MKLTLIIPAITAGGAERVMTILANHWAKQGWDITLLTCDDGSKPPFYPLDEKITHCSLNIFKKSSSLLDKILNNFTRILVLRKALKKKPSEPVISFITETNILTLIAGMGLGRPIIVCERNDPNFSFRNNGWRILRNKTYPLASRIILQLQSSVSYFSPEIQQKIDVIPNPVVKPVLNGVYKKEPAGSKTLLAMGRLTKQKGFDLLLQAFKEISPKFPNWVLHIWGEGALGKSLEELRDQLDLQDRVQFPGLTDKPHEVMKNADIFVMSSRYEGFPNVLIEAMACGLPVVSFACHGPRDIIQDGVNGVLVPPEDVPALSAALEQLMTDQEKRNYLSACSPDILDQFGFEKVTTLWESMLREVAS